MLFTSSECFVIPGHLIIIDHGIYGDTRGFGASIFDFLTYAGNAHLLVIYCCVVDTKIRALECDENSCAFSHFCPITTTVHKYQLLHYYLTLTLTLTVGLNLLWTGNRLNGINRMNLFVGNRLYEYDGCSVDSNVEMSQS